MIDDGIGFDTFDELKDYLGPAGEGKQWHHIVEQSQIGKSSFTPQQIHNTNNVMAINRGVHSKISGFYSSKQVFSGNQLVRIWLVGQSY